MTNNDTDSYHEKRSVHVLFLTRVCIVLLAIFSRVHFAQ